MGSNLRLPATLVTAALVLSAFEVHARDLDVRAIASMRSASSASLSPDGARVAYLSNESGSPQVWVSPVGGGPAVQITRSTDRVQGVLWSPASDWLAYAVSRGGGEDVQIYIVRPDGTEARLVTSGEKANNRLYGWNRDGRWLRFGTDRHSPKEIDAFLLDTQTGDIRPVGSGTGIDTIADVSPDGRFGLLNRLASRGDDNLVLVDLQSGAETLLTLHTPPATFSNARFSADGRRIFVISNVDADMAAVGVIGLDDTGQPHPFRVIAARSDAEAEALAMSADRRVLSIRWNVAGRAELSLLDAHTGKLTQGPKLPGDSIGGPLFSQDGRKLVLTLYSAAAPSDVWVADIASGAVTQVTRSTHAGVELGSLVRPTLITYRAHDGLPLSGWLYRPAGVTGPGPLVFIYHGGPESQARPSLSTDVQALVSRGMSVFMPNVRGSSGFGRRFMSLDNGPLRADAIQDIESTTKALVAQGVADSRRLGIMGDSYGGYMTLAGITQYPDMFAAAVDLFGIVDFETFFARTEPWMAAVSKVEYGDPATDRASLRALSPIHRIDKIKTPLMILHGANDTNAPLFESQQVADRLRARGQPVEFVVFPDEGHGWSRLENRVASTVGIAEFFAKHLVEAPIQP